MAPKLRNRAWMLTATTGAGTVTLGSALSGYQTFAQAGVSNGDVIRYCIVEGTNWEHGTGTYTSSGTTLSRTVIESSNAGSPITLAGLASVFITEARQDILSFAESQSWTAAEQSTARGNLGFPTVTVDNTVPRFDGTIGAVQTSSIVITDANALTGVTGITLGASGSEWTVLSNPSENVTQLQGQGNSRTTAIHLNPGSGTLPTDTISEFVLHRTLLQAFGGNYGRWSFTALGSGNSDISGVYGEFGGSVTPGPFIFNLGIENPASTFTSYEFIRLHCSGSAEAASIGTVGFGAAYTSQKNQLCLNMASIGSAGQRDSHALLWEGKANDGTERGVWWREWVDVTSNAGASSFVRQWNLNGAGWSTLFTQADTGAVAITSSAASALAVGRQGATNPALQIDASAASSATGIVITAAAAASGVGIAAISSGTDENLTINAKGAGTVTINGTATGNISLARATTITASVTVPIVIGGTGTTSTATIRATSNSGGTTGADIIFQSGNNGALEIARFRNQAGVGYLGLGTAAPNYLAQFHAPSGTHALFQLTNATTGSTASDGAYFGILNGESDFRITVLESANLRVFLNSADEKLRLDTTTTAGQTALLLWDVDNATLERVTVGAADSGGAGFKVLRLPN